MMADTLEVVKSREEKSFLQRPCASWLHVSAEAKEGSLPQVVSEVETEKLYSWQKTSPSYIFESYEVYMTYRKEVKEKFLAQVVSEMDTFRLSRANLSPMIETMWDITREISYLI